MKVEFPESIEESTRRSHSARIPQEYAFRRKLDGIAELQGCADGDQENARLVEEYKLLRATWQEPMVVPLQAKIAPPPGLGILEASQALEESTDAGSSQSPSIDACSNHSRESSIDACASLEELMGADPAQDTASFSSPPVSQFTTVFMQNLPEKYTRAMVQDLLAASGYEGSYNFAYVPINFDNDMNLGCAFVNFLTPDAAESFLQQFSEFSNWCVDTDKACEVSWCELQGLWALVDRYRNSPVMHKSVPEEFQPALFHGSRRAPFPPPTRRLRAPRNLRSKR